MHTIVVHKVGNTNAENGTLETGVEPRYALTLDDTTCRVENRGICAFRLDLGAG